MNFVDDDIVEVTWGHGAVTHTRRPRLDRGEQRLTRPIVLSTHQEPAEVEITQDLAEHDPGLAEDALRMRDVQQLWTAPLAGNKVGFESATTR
jgi:hypothetical protein